MILDVGCGKNKVEIEGEKVIGIDFNESTDADVIHDLNKFPYPFEDNTFSRIVCNNVLEHVDDLFATMDELHRIGKSNAIVYIRGPFFSSLAAFTDPTHKRSFTSGTFDYICHDDHPYGFYSDRRFVKKSFKIIFWPVTEWGIRPQEWFGLGLFANKMTRIYEKFFAFIFPAKTIEFELEIIK